MWQILLKFCFFNGKKLGNNEKNFFASVQFKIAEKSAFLKTGLDNNFFSNITCVHCVVLTFTHMCVWVCVCVCERERERERERETNVMSARSKTHLSRHRPQTNFISAKNSTPTMTIRPFVQLGRFGSQSHRTSVTNFGKILSLW